VSRAGGIPVVHGGEDVNECVDEDYLQYRVRSVAYLGEALEAAGIPVVVPFGGHAVFIDARAMLPHIDPLHYPGQALACALYTEGGARSCEIGTVMFGLHPDGTETPAPLDLVRLAIPRRTYTQSHIDYVIEVAARVACRGAPLTGLRIVSQPRQLRHFTARFVPRLPGAAPPPGSCRAYLGRPHRPVRAALTPAGATPRSPRAAGLPDFRKKPPPRQEPLCQRAARV
jgi:Beta-eliminating lyase